MNSTHEAHRHSIRLPEYDYSGNGAYFITICSNKRECLFGRIENYKMSLNECGEIIIEEWLKTPGIRREVELGEYVVMPNHFHAIILIDTVAGDRPVAPTIGAKGPRPGSIGALVAGFKSAATKRINEIQKSPGKPVWQRNYYEHVIRNEEELNKVYDYIEANPSRWAEDEENPGKEAGRV